MLVTDSFSDLLSDNTNETRALASCPVLPAMPHLWIQVKRDPQPHLGPQQMGVRHCAGLSRRSAPIKHLGDNMQPRAPTAKFPHRGSHRIAGNHTQRDIT